MTRCLGLARHQHPGHYASTRLNTPWRVEPIVFSVGTQTTLQHSWQHWSKNAEMTLTWLSLRHSNKTAETDIGGMAAYSHILSIHGAMTGKLESKLRKKTSIRRSVRSIRDGPTHELRQSTPLFDSLRSACTEKLSVSNVNIIQEQLEWWIWNAGLWTVNCFVRFPNWLAITSVRVSLDATVDFRFHLFLCRLNSLFCNNHPWSVTLSHLQFKTLKHLALPVFPG